MPLPWGALHSTTVRAATNIVLPAPKFTAPHLPGHRGLWEAAPKTGSPWGPVESFLVQVPLNIPVRNHLQTCTACQGTDCSQRPFKLWFPHPMGLCWHDATSPPGHPGCPGVCKATLCKAASRAPALGTCRNVSSTSPQPQ